MLPFPESSRHCSAGQFSDGSDAESIGDSRNCADGLWLVVLGSELIA